MEDSFEGTGWAPAWAAELPGVQAVSARNDTASNIRALRGNADKSSGDGVFMGTIIRAFVSRD
ncbi:hypothetical protein [Pseudoxanthomonas mexicana]